jgi:hypothetical protein
MPEMLCSHITILVCGKGIGKEAVKVRFRVLIQRAGNEQNSKIFPSRNSKDFPNTRKKS